MAEKDRLKNADELTIAEIYLHRIDWAFQRQLSVIAFLLGLGLGIFEVRNIATPLIYEFTYWLLAGLFLSAIGAFFYFQKEIFVNQLELFKNPRWGLRVEDSNLYKFFNVDGSSVSVNWCYVILLFIPFIIVFSIIFLDRQMPTSIFPSSNADVLVSLLQFSLGLIAGLIIFLVKDYYQRKWDKKERRDKLVRGLIVELEENLSISKENAYYKTLSTDAWSQVVNSGILFDFDKKLLDRLLTLYSKIKNKNNQCEFQNLGILFDKQFGISDAEGKIQTPLANIIAEMREFIDKEIPEVIELLKKELTKRKGNSQLNPLRRYNGLGKLEIQG